MEEGQVKTIEGYRIFLDRKMGEGSYGKVYKGEDVNSKKMVAVKMMDKKKSNYMDNLVDRD